MGSLCIENQCVMEVFCDGTRNGTQGCVVVSFVVEKDGSITEVKVVRSVDLILDKESAHVVVSMPRWIPGRQNDDAVRAQYNVPIFLDLTNSISNNLI